MGRTACGGWNRLVSTCHRERGIQMLMSAQGVTLRLQDYGEDDRMLTILTKEQGVIYAYARGAGG